ncbi:hypothetical protein QBC35DRAFT_477998 [Podospora australis]|uniref:Uncharacterized protein n=1 Tax=Podospora australis TaxID=1536484 RepID=A0AAN6WKR1_9PEZI|nr:hypothetical protein QBC35DRAFT_477998 [Podospora australis]
MSLLDGEILPFPAGDNSSDTFLGGSHLNLTTLEHWNYTLYSNNTLSNGSWCLLAWQPWTADFVFDNGTFVNQTWCWSPVNPIGPRAGIGIGFAVLYGIAIVLTLVMLNRHGRLYLPVTKRFYPIGRRWQWYWASFSCACAIISLLTVMDVDRYFLPELPIILTSFFWFLMQMGCMAMVWEAVRHWGSWMERQFIDPDPFALRDDDRRSKVEFWLPLVLYLFLWLQILDEAIPTATDIRFKIGAFFLVVCWGITVFSLRHSIKHYRPRNRGLINRVIGFVKYTPLRFKIILPLAAVVPAYQALVAWHFAYSPLNIKGLHAAIYAGGYAPTLLICYVQIIFGFINQNEDKELKRQRYERGRQLDQEMGIVQRPEWWRRINGEIVDPNESMRDRLVRNVREVQGGKPNGQSTSAPTQENPAMSPGALMEMSPLPSPTSPRVTSPPAPPYTGKSDRRRQERAMQDAADMLFPQSAAERSAAATRRRGEIVMEGPPPAAVPPPPYFSDQDRGRGSGAPTGILGERSISEQSTGSINQPPQQIRSMLDTPLITTERAATQIHNLCSSPKDLRSGTRQAWRAKGESNGV